MGKAVALGSFHESEGLAFLGPECLNPAVPDNPLFLVWRGDNHF